jgi:hypothetical protein
MRPFVNIRARWILAFLWLLVLPLAMPAKPLQGQQFANPTLGIRYQAPPGALLVTDPKTLEIVMTKGFQVAHIRPTTTQEKALGLQFVVTWKGMVRPPFAPNVNFLTEALPRPMTDAQYLRANVRTLGATMQDFKLISQGQPRPIGGRKFFCLEWQATMGTGRAHVRNYLRVNPRSHRAYVITLTDLAQRKGANFAKLEKLLAGFRFSS